MRRVWDAPRRNTRGLPDDGKTHPQEAEVSVVLEPRREPRREAVQLGVELGIGFRSGIASP